MRVRVRVRVRLRVRVTLLGEAPACWPARCARAPLAGAEPVRPSFFLRTLASELTLTWGGDRGEI